MKKKELDELDDSDLLKLFARVESELKRRGVKYSVGDIGEVLAVEYFNSTKGLPTLRDAPVGTKNVDALSRDGDRYSIKTIMKGSKTGTIYPDPEEYGKQLFEYLIVVRLEEDYTLQSLHRVSWGVFKDVRAWDKRMSAWYIPLSRSRLRKAETLFSNDKDEL